PRPPASLSAHSVTAPRQTSPLASGDSGALVRTSYASRPSVIFDSESGQVWNESWGRWMLPGTEAAPQTIALPELHGQRIITLEPEARRQAEKSSLLGLAARLLTRALDWCVLDRALRFDVLGCSTLPESKHRGRLCVPFCRSLDGGGRIDAVSVGRNYWNG